jgi:isopentenyl-diphosphate Delta-isomerase
MTEEQVILVDQNDVALGSMFKQLAHTEGKLHRAFSVFIFNRNGELLLQQRALNKYHSAGKWTNTCCSHPRPGEETLEAAHRRLKEEMGMECILRPAFCFQYHAFLDNGLIEHEYDHVYFGSTDFVPVPNPDEVANFEYINLLTLEKELANTPEKYTAWLKICFEELLLTYKKMHPHG